ncbi:MAG: hypothetical protein OXU45_08400 [Candidatus Melainabacteria bacterium]|nr:hypothetical protein [Candidatus Melainabacteria bacterium]
MKIPAHTIASIQKIQDYQAKKTPLNPEIAERRYLTQLAQLFDWLDRTSKLSEDELSQEFPQIQFEKEASSEGDSLADIVAQSLAIDDIERPELWDGQADYQAEQNYKVRALLELALRQSETAKDKKSEGLHRRTMLGQTAIAALTSFCPIITASDFIINNVAEPGNHRKQFHNYKEEVLAAIDPDILDPETNYEFIELVDAQEHKLGVSLSRAIATNIPRCFSNLALQGYCIARLPDPSKVPKSDTASNHRRMALAELRESIENASGKEFASIAKAREYLMEHPELKSDPNLSRALENLERLLSQDQERMTEGAYSWLNSPNAKSHLAALTAFHGTNATGDRANPNLQLYQQKDEIIRLIGKAKSIETIKSGTRDGLRIHVEEFHELARMQRACKEVLNPDFLAELAGSSLARFPLAYANTATLRRGLLDSELKRTAYGWRAIMDQRATKKPS